MRAKQIMIIVTICCMLLPAACFASECEFCSDGTTSCFVDTYGVAYCDGVLVHYPEELELTEYHIDARTRIIGESAFSGNEYLQEVFIPDGVVMIQDFAFEGCSSLITAHLPDSLLIIGADAFAVCTALENIHLPDTLYCIGSQAFCDTWSLKRIVLPESLRFVGDEAFANSGIQEAFVHTVLIQCGYTVFTPSFLDPGETLLLHFQEDVLTEEIGSVYSWIEALQQSDKVVIRYDILSGE